VAIYYLSANQIGRSSGRSATGAAAYRAGAMIVDKRTGEVHDYTRKGGVLHSEIILPGGGTEDRAELWNKIETHHKRGDAVLVREIVAALPGELTAEERQALAVGYARELADRYGVAVDVALHAPRTVTDRELEQNPDQHHETDPATGRRHNGNWHAHIMLSACHVSPSGELGKKAVELDPIHCKRAKIENMADRERGRWADLCNERLKEKGMATIDHRSLEAQGIDREPEQHRGPAVSAILRRGEQSIVQERIEQEQEPEEEIKETLEFKKNPIGNGGWLVLKDDIERGGIYQQNEAWRDPSQRWHAWLDKSAGDFPDYQGAEDFVRRQLEPEAPAMAQKIEPEAPEQEQELEALQQALGGMSAAQIQAAWMAARKTVEEREARERAEQQEQERREQELREQMLEDNTPQHNDDFLTHDDEGNDYGL
jgi:hypothetical protein